LLIELKGHEGQINTAVVAGPGAAVGVQQHSVHAQPGDGWRVEGQRRLQRPAGYLPKVSCSKFQQETYEALAAPEKKLKKARLPKSDFSVAFRKKFMLIGL